ncbi:MAG: ABC transporter substrate-binding protein [Pseudomonadota bacterium]
MSPFRILSTALLLAGLFATGSAAAAGRVLTIINWEEFLSPAAIQTFEKRENAKIVQLHFSTVEESLKLAQANAGKADLMVGGMVVAQQLKAKGLLQKLDRAKLTNVKHALPQFELDPDHVVPYLWGYTGIAWRTDKVKEPVDSYAKLLELARKNPGKVTLTDDGMEFAHAALLMYGKPPYNPDDLPAVKAALAAYAKEGSKLFRIQPSVYEPGWPLTSGEAIAAQVYNGDIHYHRVNHKAPLAYTNPKEGCFFWQEGMMVMARAPQVELAHAFLNYLNEGRVAARNAEYISYASANPFAVQYYSREFLDNPYIRPKLEGTTGCRVNKPLSPATQKFLDTLKPYGIKP